MQHTLDLPTGYRLRRDPDILTLCRSDGSMVARFSGAGADLNEIRKAAEQDYYPGTIYNHETPTPDAVTDQPCLQVRFFGHFEILCNGEPVGLGRNGKVLTIFKYLLAHRDSQVSRDHLMEWLWPESSLKKARSSLNVAICTLRRLLSECSAGLQNYILLEEGYYRLCPTVWVETDVEEFDLRYEQGCRLEKINRIGGPPSTKEPSSSTGVSTSWSTCTKIGPWSSASASPTPTWACWNGSPCTTNRASSFRSASSIATGFWRRIPA